MQHSIVLLQSDRKIAQLSNPIDLDALIIWPFHKNEEFMSYYEIDKLQNINITKQPMIMI